MIGPVTQATNTQTAPLAASANKKPSDAKPQTSTGIQDTVQLSSTAQGQLTGIKAVMQESTEMPTQTAQEARGGDLQARRLLAKEAANAKMAEGK